MGWRWQLAVVLWLGGLILLVVPDSAQAAVELGDLRFGLGDVLLIFAAGLAWNDIKRDVKELRKDYEEFRDTTRKGGQ